ncbi:uncharacterized protein LOC124497764 [Dermatophagoides farinae]|uniref:uncharacterized protein LOC124497764 n=1 Tax=Dermatophagoides farinae TaxID=6954 RepID=UPI003F60050E
MESTPMKRMSYTAEFKLKVIKYAKIHGNRASSRYFNINEKCIRDWRKRENELRRMPKYKRSNRGTKRLIRPEHIEYEHFNGQPSNDLVEINDDNNDGDDDVDISIEVAPDISEDLLNGLDDDVSLDFIKQENNFPQIMYDVYESNESTFKSNEKENNESKTNQMDFEIELKNLDESQPPPPSSSSSSSSSSTSTIEIRTNDRKKRKKIIGPDKETGTLFDFGMKAIKVIGAIELDDKNSNQTKNLCYVIKFENNQCDIVMNKVAQKFCPQILFDFLESRIEFDEKNDIHLPLSMVKSSSDLLLSSS